MTLGTLPLSPALATPSAAVPAARTPHTMPAQRRLDLQSLIRRTNDLLAAGVPLTLLMDLTDPAGPHSQALFTDEVGDLDWLRV